MAEMYIGVPSTRQARAVESVLAERSMQDKVFGKQNHHPAYWLAILGKQVGQLGSAVVDREWANEDNKPRMLDKVRDEAVQVAAVAVAMIEAIDRGEVPTGLVTAQPGDPRQRARALNRDDESIYASIDDYEEDYVE